MENQIAPRINLSVESTLDVTHFEVLTARFGNESKLTGASWNWLLGAAHVHGYYHLLNQGIERGVALKSLSKTTHHKIREGESAAKGMVYLSEIGVSIQGRSAARALENTKRIAYAIGSDFEVRVRRPSGEEAVLWWSPEGESRRLDELLGLGNRTAAD